MQAAAEAYHQARPAASVTLLEDSTTTERSVFDPDHPGPDINRTVANQFQSAPFDILLIDKVHGSFCQGIRPHEFLRLMGESANLHIDNEWTDNKLYDRMTWRTPTTTIQWATQMILLSDHATTGPINETDNQSADTTRLPVLMNRANINEWTTLPLPTVQQWQLAVSQDHDLKRVATALKTRAPLVKNELREKEWHK
jgi:hypothetical protein